VPAAAADEDTAKARAGANASVEGGTSLGSTGVRSDAQTGSAPRTRSNEDKPKPKARAKRKVEKAD
jgi:hypothetical protein